MLGSERSVSYPRAYSFSPSGGSPEPDVVAPRRKLRMWWSTTACQLFEELVPIGNMTREGFLEHPEECRRDCCVLVVPLKIRDSLALMIDVALAALNAAFGFLKVSLQEGTLHAVILTSSGQRWPAGGLRLDQRCSDRSPLRLNTDDSKNSHSAETKVGLRLMVLSGLCLVSNPKTRLTFAAKHADPTSVPPEQPCGLGGSGGPKPGHGLSSPPIATESTHAS
jgi:hypothetical protein